MLEEAAFLAQGGVEQPLHYLRSRILARHTHAMLKRGVTLVTVYLEPGMRASGINLWLMEVWAACILCFDGPWIAMGDWNLEPQDLSQAGWLDTVNGKVFASSAATCAGGAGVVLDYFAVCEAMAHLVQQVEVVDNSPTAPHWPVRHTQSHVFGSQGSGAKTAEAVPHGGASGTATPGGTLELAWLEWLRAAEAALCRIHDLFRAQRRPFLGRSKGLVIELQQKGRGLARPTTLGGAGGWQPGRLEEGADLAAHVTTVSSHACFNLVARPWPLGQAGIFRHKKLWHTLCGKLQPVEIGHSRSHGSWFSSKVPRNKQSTLRLQMRRVAGGNGRRKLARGRQAQHTASPRLASTTARSAGWPGRSCLSSKWRHGCCHGWTRAEPMPSSWPTRRIGESHCQDLHSKRPTMFAKHTIAQQVWVTTASTPRLFCSCQSNCEHDSSVCSWPSRQRWSNPCAGLT